MSSRLVGVCEATWIPMSWNLLVVVPLNLRNVVTAGTNAFLSDDCEQWLEPATGRHSRGLS